MLKRKLQDLTVCCTYKVEFLHQKAHSVKEFRKQYEVHEEIGRGGFGVVYEAIRIVDNLSVAVKFIEHKHVREWTMSNSQLVPSEVCHLETCSNIPGVIRLIDWFASSKGFLIVMERPEKCMDVFDLVSTYGKLDEGTARAIFSQVVDTVCGMYAKHGLIHRDIKDENIIVDMRTGEVKLVDLGATASIEKATKKEFQGTRSYCPPEWFRQLQYLPLEATSWSLGVLLFILVTGQLPFKNEIQICLGRVKFPTYLTKECCQLIKSCLTTACSSRASLASIKQHPWMSHPIATHSMTFQQVLDKTLGRKDRRNISEIDAEQAAEEYRQVNDVVLTEEALPVEKDCSDTCSDSTMATATDDCPPLPSMSRLKSRYDNISNSSLAEYMSLVSLATTGFEKADTVSMATTGMYFSATETEDEEESFGELSGPVKSASAYNLANKGRRRSMVFKSFDRELDTVLEQGYEHLPLVMTVSASSNVSQEEPTLRESPPPSPRRRTTHSESTSTDEDFSFGGDIPLHCRPSPLNPSTARPSRHRPLKMTVGAPSLSVFEAKPMAAT